MSLTPSVRALPLIQKISRAACAPDYWNDFVAALAAELHDATIGMALDLPSSEGPTLTYSNFPAASTGTFAAQVASGGLPWSLGDVSTEGFRSLSALLPDDQLAETSYYSDYMVSLGLALALIAHSRSRGRAGNAPTR